MSKIYVFASGEKYISIDGKCYIRTGGKGLIDTDSSRVVIHDSLDDCTGSSANTTTSTTDSTAGGVTGSSGSTSSTTQPAPLPVVTPGSMALTTTFYRVNLNDLTDDQQTAIIESQEEAITANLASYNSDDYSLSTTLIPGSVRANTIISLTKQTIFADFKQTVHNATSKGVSDVTGFLFKLSQRMSYKLKLLASPQSLIDDLLDDVSSPDFDAKDPEEVIDDPNAITADDYESWKVKDHAGYNAAVVRFKGANFNKGPYFRTLNIPKLLDPRLMKYISYQGRCWRFDSKEDFDEDLTVYEGEIWDTAQCEFEWPDLNKTNNGANWELSLYYGLVERGFYVSEWYSPVAMSKGAGFNRQVCVPRDRVIGIRYPSDHELKIAKISIDPTGFVNNNMTAEQFKQQEVDSGNATLTDVDLKRYPTQEETNVANEKVNNKLIVFGGDYALSNEYLANGWYIYYSDSHAKMIGWLRVTDNSEDCKDTA